MQATLWANVSWMDHTVKVRSTTCQVEGKRLILKMNLLPSFGDINKKKHTLSGKTLCSHFALPVFQVIFPRPISLLVELGVLLIKLVYLIPE